MKNIKYFLAFIMIIAITIGLCSCDFEKTRTARIIDIEDLELINLEQFSEVARDSFPDSETTLLDGGHQQTFTSMDPLHICFRCEEHINSSRARHLFETMFDIYNDFAQDEDVITEFEDDRGYIIFDLVTEERISEVTGISETRLCLDRNDMGYYCFCMPPCNCFADIAADLRAQEEAEGIIPRRIGCIYYYDNMYIETILDSSDEEEIEEFLDFLDELGLPYLLQEE